VGSFPGRIALLADRHQPGRLPDLWYDKSIAGSRRSRVPERVLLWLALILGSLGAWLGMQVFHHKTLKGSFQRRFWLVVIIQVAVIILYYWVVK